MKADDKGDSESEDLKEGKADDEYKSPTRDRDGSVAYLTFAHGGEVAIVCFLDFFLGACEGMDTLLDVARIAIVVAPLESETEEQLTPARVSSQGSLVWQSLDQKTLPDGVRLVDRYVITVGASVTGRNRRCTGQGEIELRIESYAVNVLSRSGS